MRYSLLLSVMLICVLVSGITTKKQRKYKKASSSIQDMDKKLQAILRRKSHKTSRVPKTPDEMQPTDPCEKKKCGAGRECITNGSGQAECPCVADCPQFHDERRVVCSNYNNTWPSDCKLHQVRCWCSQNHSECPDHKYSHMHIDYYGSCQHLPECSADEMSDFPRRMREWMFNIMNEMADEGTLSESFMNSSDASQKWLNAAVLKWCLLNDHPKDRYVSRHELFPLRAALHAMEHCISPFLDSCDPDNSHTISLQEWVTCLHLKKDHVEKIGDLCAELRPSKP